MVAEKSYDYRPAFAELPMLRYYLVEHTHHDASVDIDALFGGETYQIPKEQVDAVSTGFNTWLLETIAAGEPSNDDKDRAAIFSSLYEYALWAANVRKANAGDDGDADVRERLASTPSYDPTIH